MMNNSWVIIRRDTREAMTEIWDEKIIKHLKPEFEAIPTHEYLIELNRKIKNFK